MELAVGGSVMVDLATKDDLAEHHRRLKDLFPEKPRGRYYSIYGAGATTAAFAGSGPIAVSVNPPFPPAGRLWFVQWVAVFRNGLPAEPTIANLNSAIMVGRAPIGPGGPIAAAISGAVSDADVVVPGLAVPSNYNVPDKTVVKSETGIYVVLSGAGLAASTTYVISAGVIDVPDNEEVYFW